ncbi:hypothetical protein HanRHA438_Chr08g0343101 [Helianthus annuus]|nr:hypothetical protein HanRHA438_Chr08g0343101 [Helianthus annuus]
MTVETTKIKGHFSSSIPCISPPVFTCFSHKLLSSEGSHCHLPSDIHFFNIIWMNLRQIIRTPLWWIKFSCNESIQTVDH